MGKEGEGEERKRQKKKERIRKGKLDSRTVEGEGE